MSLKETLTHLLNLMLPGSDRDPFVLDRYTWQDVVYFARRVGWSVVYDEDGECRSVGVNVNDHHSRHCITLDKETRRPYYTFLCPITEPGTPVWLGSLEQLLGKIMEVS